MRGLAGYVPLLWMVGLPAAIQAVAAPPQVSRPASAATQGISDPRVVVNSIEVLGVTVFDQPALESALELAEGERFDRGRVVRSAENLRQMYEMRGYHEMRANIELVRAKNASGSYDTVLRINVKEGVPTRIASIRWVSSRTDDPAENASWDALEKELQAALGLQVGDIYDREIAAKGRRGAYDILVGREFVGAKVEEERVVPAEAPERWVKAGSEPQTARWVMLEFRVDSGDRVTFGFRGNTVFTKSRLINLLEEQRLIGFSKDYIGSIKNRIEQEYQSIGYSEVSVKVYTFERSDRAERHVTFAIDEGPRVTIESVDFDGNNIFDNGRLVREFFARAPLMTRRRYFIEKEVEKAAELVIEWIRSQGYLGAKMVTVNRTFVAKKRSVRLLVYIYEGEQTIVQSIRLSGLNEISREEVLKILGVQENEPLNLFNFNEGLENLKVAYRARGFLGVRILNEGTDSVVRYSLENRAADILIEVDEGYKYKVSRIELDGLTDTHEEVIRRELQFAPEDVLEEGKISESEARIRRLGLFSGVSIRGYDDPERLGYKVVKITVQEGTPGLLAFGFGFRKDLGARIFGQTAYSNLFHQNHTLSLNANLNWRRLGGELCEGDKERDCFLEYQLQLAYTWPWFAGPITFRPRAAIERTRYIRFDAFTQSLSATWERNLIKQPNLTGIFTYSLERIEQSNALSAEDNAVLTIGSIIPSLRLDMRNNSLAPTSGLFALASFELASPAFLSQTDPYPVGYMRFQGRIDGFVPLAEEITWFLSFRVGFERNNEPPPADNPDDKTRAIPLIKQFALGGAGSLRGFREQELNVQDLAIRGTASYVNYRTQIDLPFSGKLRFGPFLDAANLLVDRFSFGMLRYGAGIGLHYLSPVGPVNFDWGFKIDPRPGEETNHLYFSIGVI